MYNIIKNIKQQTTATFIYIAYLVTLYIQNNSILIKIIAAILHTNIIILINNNR